MSRQEGFALPVTWLLAWAVDAVTDAARPTSSTDYCLAGPEEN